MNGDGNYGGIHNWICLWEYSSCIRLMVKGVTQYKMKCPKCGSPRARYKVSRRKNWKGQGASTFGESKKPRMNFEVKCPKCGWRGEIK